MSVSDKTNYNKNKKYWKRKKKKNLSVATHIQYCLPQFSMRYCSKSLRKNSSKLGFVTMFLQVYKDFFCSKTNRRSLRWVKIGICIERESSNVLNKICLFESCTFLFMILACVQTLLSRFFPEGGGDVCTQAIWYSLNHLKVLEKNSFDSWLLSNSQWLKNTVEPRFEGNLIVNKSFLCPWEKTCLYCF